MLAIPPKRSDRAPVTFLDEHEIDALLAAPDRTTWTGRRDHAMLLTAIQTGLRASELIGLNCSDVHLAAGAHVSCRGKGRKQRITPLTHDTVAMLRPSGSPNATANPTSRCSPPAAADGSAATASSAGSPNTSRPRQRTCPSLHEQAHHAAHPPTLRGRLGYVAGWRVSLAGLGAGADSGHITRGVLVSARLDDGSDLR